MRHLSALDALFLHLETPETPMHVGSLILLETPPAKRGKMAAAIRKHIADRLHLAPLFTRKLQFMPFDLANPVWLDAGKPDMKYHVQTRTLPKPGTQAQLEAMVAKLHEGTLDRSRPLWQFVIIDGLQSGETAFYSRVHHAALDGQGGVALAQAVLDAEPKPKRSAADRTAKPASLAPSTAKMLSAALSNTVAQYARIVRAVPDAVKAVSATTAAMAMSRKLSADIGLKADVKPNVDAKAIAKGLPLGPRASFNAAIGGPRVFSTVSLPLDEAKAIARHFGVKLNDVVLCEIAGALRKALAGDRKLLSKPMIGAVPASLRAPGDTTANNQVTMMLVALATQIADPVKRLAAIHVASNKAKMLTGGMKSVIPTDLPSLGVPWLMSALTSLYNTTMVANRIPVIANLVISNVPGPQVPLYLAGARVTAYYPVSIVTHGLGLNITILSYDGSLDFGLVACKKSLREVRTWAGHIESAHRELLALVAKSAGTAAKPAGTKARSDGSTAKPAPKNKARVKPKQTQPRSRQ
jgi:diacylglycerol O-acyltransferase